MAATRACPDPSRRSQATRRRSDAMGSRALPPRALPRPGSCDVGRARRPGGLSGPGRRVQPRLPCISDNPLGGRDGGCDPRSIVDVRARVLSRRARADAGMARTDGPPAVPARDIPRAPHRTPSARLHHEPHPRGSRRTLHPRSIVSRDRGRGTVAIHGSRRIARVSHRTGAAREARMRRARCPTSASASRRGSLRLPS